LDSAPNPPTRSWLLKKADQAALAAINLVALVAIAGWWLWAGGQRGRLIEIDRQNRETISFQLDVNSADWPEWTLLPEIGETLAKRIVESREREGPFRDLDDLRRVRGIGPRTLEKIRPYLQPVPEVDAVATK
jgi:competence protein ComEA